MTRAGFEARVRGACALPASPWVAGLALVAGALAARAIVHFAPATGGDVERARALGIVSPSILAGYSKSAESLAAALAFGGALATSLGLWLAWALWAGSVAAPAPSAVRPRVTRFEHALVWVLGFLLFARLWNAHSAWSAPWVALSEEGEMLAWIDTVSRGGALSRDVFCLYGPLSSWLVAALFALFGPSLALWRTWIFALCTPALVATYFLLRGILRTRAAPAAGVFAIALVCAPPIPAMSWSLSRVGLALAALAALTRVFQGGANGWRIAVGVLLGATLLYSQEVGVACSMAAAAALAMSPTERLRATPWIALGAALTLAPALVYLIASGSLAATVDNLFLFPRIRLLGFGAYPFPPLAPSLDSLCAYGIPAVLAVSAFATGAKLLRGERDDRVLTELGLIVFGGLLFTTALSRPDQIHFAFAAPPAFALLAGLIEDACFALRSRSHRAAAVVGLALAATVLSPWWEWASYNAPTFFLAPGPELRPLALPRAGGARFPDWIARDLEAVTRAIQLRTAPDEPFWVFPNEALLYFLADRPQPTRYPLALFAVTRDQRHELLRELERTKPRWAVLCLDPTLVDGIPYETALPELVEYLHATYELESRLGTFALMRRKS